MLKKNVDYIESFQVFFHEHKKTTHLILGISTGLNSSSRSNWFSFGISISVFSNSNVVRWVFFIELEDADLGRAVAGL